MTKHRPTAKMSQNKTHDRVSDIRLKAPAELPTVMAPRGISAPSSRTLPAGGVRGSTRIESMLVDDIKPNPKNARTHSKKHIRLIAESLKKFGFLNPILVDEHNTILAGHGRLEAARWVGLTTVPIVRFDHLSAAQKRAYLIADNRIAEQAGWDREMLAIELGELIDLLPAEGLDVSLTGFEAAENSLGD